MDWKGQLAVAIGIFAIIAVMVVYVIPATSNRLPLRSDVRVGEVHEEQSGGIISLLHYAVWGKVVLMALYYLGLSRSHLTSHRQTAHCYLRRTRLSSRILYRQDKWVLSHSNSRQTIWEDILVMIGRTMSLSVNNNFLS